MTDSTEPNALVAEFSRETETYTRLGATVADLLVEMLADEKIIVHSVTHRSKSVGSLAKKVTRAEKTYASLQEVTDLAAVRVTTYFALDVDKIARIVEREFDVDRPNSVDKRTSLDPDRFGYQSLHYVVTLGSGRSGLVEYRKFITKKVEIQIRSILQHAWAEIEHDLGYKSVSGVPRDIRRRFARVAGLLEIADDEFSALREALRKYESEVPAKIASDPAGVDLDLLSLRASYTTSSALAALDRSIASIASAELRDGAPDSLERTLNRLLYVGIRTVSELDRAAFDNHDLASQFAKVWLEGKSYQHLPVGIGTLYLAYVLMAARKDKGQFIQYLDAFNIGEAEARNDTADRALATLGEIQQSFSGKGSA